MKIKKNDNQKIINVIPNGLLYGYIESTINDNGDKREIIKGSLYIENDELVGSGKNYKIQRSYRNTTIMLIYDKSNRNDMNMEIKMLNDDENDEHITIEGNEMAMKYDCSVGCVCENEKEKDELPRIYVQIFRTLYGFDDESVMKRFWKVSESECTKMGSQGFECEIDDLENQKCVERKRPKLWQCLGVCYDTENEKHYETDQVFFYALTGEDANYIAETFVLPEKCEELVGYKINERDLKGAIVSFCIEELDDGTIRTDL